MSRGKGRPRKPDAMKKLTGTLQPCRKSEEPEFETIKQIPAPPSYMNNFGVELYKTTTRMLAGLNILNELNLPIAVGYANEMGKYWEAEDQLNRTGRLDITKDADGNILKVERLVLDKMATEYYRNAKSYAVELGITPASAGRIKSAGPKKTNPFADF